MCLRRLRVSLLGDPDVPGGSSCGFVTLSADDVIGRNLRNLFQNRLAGPLLVVSTDAALPLLRLHVVVLLQGLHVVSDSSAARRRSESTDLVLFLLTASHLIQQDLLCLLAR